VVLLATFPVFAGRFKVFGQSFAGSALLSSWLFQVRSP
jgi:hypothetical protein